MLSKKFEGWYFKHQKDNNIISFIPGISESGCFIQVLTNELSYNINIKKIICKNNIIKSNSFYFSEKECCINLPDVKGKLKYYNITKLKSDIMGPFKNLPMQCRHGVISMRHDIYGKLMINNKLIDFDNGIGYIEKDSGYSFPKSYLWIQCNDFSEQCSFMISIADIPFIIKTFTGCICSILYKGKEYRIATYNGVKIKKYTADQIILQQNDLILNIIINNTISSHCLFSPIQGHMTGKIRESTNVGINLILKQNNKTIFDIKSNHAMYEFVSNNSIK